jgi:hypothetical protein
MQTVLHIVIYVFSALYIALALGLCFAYYRMRHSGMLLMGLIYGAAAGAALTYMHWWPLVAGLVLNWVMRLMGVEPGTNEER